MDVNSIKRRPGRIVVHQDGRKGIAYNDDQYKQYQEKNQAIVRFFTDSEDLSSELSKEKRAVNYDKLQTIGYID